MHALHKQNGCFINPQSCYPDCMNNLAQFILQPQYTDIPWNICERVITNALPSCSEELACSNASRWFSHICYWILSAGSCFTGCLATQLCCLFSLSATKVTTTLTVVFVALHLLRGLVMLSINHSGTQYCCASVTPLYLFVLSILLQTFSNQDAEMLLPLLVSNVFYFYSSNSYRFLHTFTI